MFRDTRTLDQRMGKGWENYRFPRQFAVGSDALTRTFVSTPNGIRTRAAALKGRCPRPLDDGGETCQRNPCGSGRAPGVLLPG